MPDTSPPSARQIVEAMRGGKPIRKLPEHLLVTCEWNTVPKIVDRALSCSAVYNNAPIFASKAGLIRSIARNFHLRSGTLTPAVSETLSLLLTRGAVLTRVAHTPDFLPYVGVCYQMLVAEVAREAAFRTGRVATTVFLVIDSDICADTRIRTAKVPDRRRHDSELRLTCTVPRHRRHVVVAAAPPPTEVEVAGWIRALESHIYYHVPSRIRSERAISREGCFDNLFNLESHLRFASRNSRSLAEFNMIVLSRLANIEWKLPIVFVSQLQLGELLEEVIEYATVQRSKFSRAVVEAHRRLEVLGVSVSPSLVSSLDRPPFWMICSTCNSRIATDYGSTHGIIIGTCNRCEKSYAHHIGKCPWTNTNAPLVPKVLLDSLVDSYGWGMTVGASYIGSAEHVLLVAEMTRELFGISAFDILSTARSDVGDCELASPGTPASRSPKHRVTCGRSSIALHWVYEGPNRVRSGLLNHLHTRGLNFPRDLPQFREMFAC